ncbi:MAG TPA: DNA repair protein RecN, partial [Gammaproteobacteria bacterium]|nr:DNA repair protein RecN [Gammaproteobacteria bacterium]
MLTDLHIRDFAIIESLRVTFGPGMTAFTGETGAGKSILLDALGLVLGDRASAELIRSGAERAEVAARFELGALPAVRAHLAEAALDEGDECVIRRVVSVSRGGSATGSRAFINGRPATLEQLRTLAGQLVEIHGQHEHVALMRSEAQRELLDAFGRLDAERAAVQRAWQAVRQLQRQLESLAGAGDDFQARLDLLRYQVTELEGLALGADEPAALAAEQRRLAHGEQLLAQGQAVLDRLYDADEASAHHLIARAVRELDELLTFEPGLAEAHELFDSAAIQLQEGADALRRQLEQVELDPARLQAVQQRLDALHDLARKHRVALDELPAHAQRLQAELDELSAGEADQARLSEALEAAQADYLTAAAALSQARRQAAGALATAVTGQLADLGMAAAELQVQVARDAATLAASGQDQVQFLVRTNPGAAFKPLARIASGGELSRMSLAVQVVAAAGNPVPCLVFDE